MATAREIRQKIELIDEVLRETALPEEELIPIRRILELVHDVLEQRQLEREFDSTPQGDHLAEVLSFVIEPDIRDDRRNVIGWSREVLSRLREALSREAESPTVVQNEPEISRLVERVELSDQQLAREEETEALRARALGAVDEVEEAVTAARAAAGIVGDANLAIHFGNYANREAFAANAFRILTIATIIAAVVVAVQTPHPDAGDWVAFAYRLAVIAGVTGLAAYFGRQAGQHRRMFNWAKTTQVQLKSFAAFIAPVNDADVQGRIYETFAQRVLGPPPEKGVNQSEAQVLSPQLMDFITAVVKKE